MRPVRRFANEDHASAADEGQDWLEVDFRARERMRGIEYEPSERAGGASRHGASAAGT